MAHRQAVLVAIALLMVPAPSLEGRQRFSSGTLGVRVDVLVTDGRNPIGGLTANDFELRDNGVVQRVEVVDSADVPINAQTLAPLEQIDAGSDASSADPWWDYQLGAGRDVTELLAGVWARAKTR
jgi:hypothetical protein